MLPSWKDKWNAKGITFSDPNETLDTMVTFFKRQEAADPNSTVNLRRAGRGSGSGRGDRSRHRRGNAQGQHMEELPLREWVIHLPFFPPL